MSRWDDECDEMLSRFERGESAAMISESTGTIEFWVHRKLAEARRRKFNWDGNVFRGMSNRTTNALVGAGLWSVDQVTKLTSNELGSVAGLGKKGVAEVAAWLAARGLTIRPSGPKVSTPREPPKSIPLAIKFLERHGYTVIPPEKDD